MRDEDCLQVACEAAKAGGQQLRRLWGKAKALYTKSSIADIVTEADKASEEAILEILAKYTPHYATLSEESGASSHTHSEFLWVVDPLDGTTNYSHSYPMISISIALLCQNAPLAAVVYDPLHNELFCCLQASGAYLNDTMIRASAIGSLERSLLATGFPYDRKTRKDDNYAQFCYMTHHCHGVRRGGSAALDLAYVAAGRLDGFWEKGLKVWDIAAGILLIQEAGGLVSGWQGEAIDLWSGSIVATNGHLHAALCQGLADAEGFLSL